MGGGYDTPHAHAADETFYYKHVGHKGIQAVTVFGDLPKFKYLCHFEIFVNTEPFGAGNFKTLLLLQFSSDQGQSL